MRNAYIRGIDYYLPQRILTNEELVSEFPEWTVDKIASKVGVERRRIAADGQTATDMAVKAAERLFENNPEIDRTGIDFVILCTQSPDYFLPSSSCIIQSRLGLRQECGAFDFNLGCSGYVYGLAVAKGLIAASIASNVLLLTAETYSRYLHPRDKGNRTIFGDAASATLISTDGFALIREFALGTDGSGAENLIVRSGGARKPMQTGSLEFDENGNPISDDHLRMNGAEIFNFTQEKVPIVVRECLEKNGMTPGDVSMYVFHQANSYMLNFLRKKMKISPERFLIDMKDYGNTVSNTIPIALANAGKNLSGGVLLCGFGVGYSWGACVIDYSKENK